MNLAKAVMMPNEINNNLCQHHARHWYAFTWLRNECPSKCKMLIVIRAAWKQHIMHAGTLLTKRLGKLRTCAYLYNIIVTSFFLRWLKKCQIPLYKSERNVCLLTYEGIICSVINLEIVLPSQTEMTTSAFFEIFLRLKEANCFFPVVLPTHVWAAWEIELMKLPFFCQYILYFFS